MWDFDDDEVFFMVVAGIFSLITVLRFYTPLSIIPGMVSRRTPRLLLGILPTICGLLILLVLMNWSDPQTVRGHIDYMTLFMLGSIPFILFPTLYAPLLGFTVRDDIVERNNSAAAIALAGMIIGNALCYAGSNIGSGPTIWTTIVPALLAVGTLFFSLLIITWTSGSAETIAIERHVPTGLTLAGYSILSGGILAWAASGDWQSWPQTMSDFAFRGWPILILAVGAAMAIRAQKPRCILASAQ